MLAREWLKRSGKSILFAILFFVVAKIFASIFADLIKINEYEILQGHFAKEYPSRAPKPRPPLVIDISRFDPPNGDEPTDRNKLNQLLNQLSQYNPAAIGIDIDFSSSSKRLVDPIDFYYFNQWKNLKSGEGGATIPVRLGVANRIGEGENWLGRPEFSRLAAGIAVPKDSNSDYFFTRVGEDPRTELPQMAFALYKASQGKLNTKDAAMKLYGEAENKPESRERSESSDYKLYYGTFIVDYSAMPDIKHDLVFLGENVAEINKLLEPRIKNNIVLIGDERKAFSEDDRFSILGDPAHTYGGVLAHACSIVTLREGPPGRLDPTSTNRVDYVLLVSTLALVVVIHFAVSWSEQYRTKHHLDRGLRTLRGSKPKLYEGLIYSVGTRNFERMEVLVSLAMAIILVFAFTLFFDPIQAFWPEHLYIAGFMFLLAVLGGPLWPVIVRCLKAAGKFHDEKTRAQVP